MLILQELVIPVYIPDICNAMGKPTARIGQVKNIFIKNVKKRTTRSVIP